MLTTQGNNTVTKSLDEQILVVPRTTLLGDTPWQGLKVTNFDEYISIINTHKEFLPRSIMEQDQRYKQIIPYLVFQYQNTYFLMQRQAKASEQRLQNKFTLGIGGHIRQEDMTHDSIFEWARREFHEEVEYTGNITIKPLGILNDDSTPVGQVHIGFVLLLQGDSPFITVKSELKSGTLMTFQECQAYYPTMETWSQIVLNFLKNS